jgi:hypothetical protein
VVRVTAKRTARSCRACTAPFAIDAQLVPSEGQRPIRLRGLCARCLARVIDQAFGWRLEANVLQGLASRALSDEIQERKRQEKLAAR